MSSSKYHNLNLECSPIRQNIFAQLLRYALALIMGLILSACGGGGGSGISGGELGSVNNLRVDGTSITSVSLSWQYTGSMDTTTGFYIYRDGKKVSTSVVRGKTDYQLWPSTTYCYQVKAYNLVSSTNLSNRVCTQTKTDENSPSTPRELLAVVDSVGSVSLSWLGSLDDHEVIGYKIRRDSQELFTVTETSARDTSVNIDTDYCYTVAAIDPTGNESEQTPAFCADTSWRNEILDNDADIGGGIGIALDSSGSVHVSYYDKKYGAIKYASNNGGSWSIMYIDFPGGSQYPDNDIAVDNEGFIHLCYVDTINRQVKYASNRLGFWLIETIDNGGSVKNECAITTDSQNNAHVVYLNQEIVHATNASVGWVASVIPDTFSARSVALAIDTNDKVHISFSLDGINHVNNRSGSWQLMQIDSQCSNGSRSAIQIDSQNNIHLVYSCTFYIPLLYASNKTGVWVSEKLVDKGEYDYPDFTIDSQNKLHVSYRDGDISRDNFSKTQALKYITDKSGSWKEYAIKSAGFYSAIVVDSNSDAHIVSNSSSQLLYATNR